MSPESDIGFRDISPTVLNFPFTESSEILDSLRFPSKILTGIPASEASGLLHANGYTPDGPLVLPETDGKLDLDLAHFPMLDEIQKHYKDRLPGLPGFEHRYPMPGSEASIQLLIAEWVSNGTMTELGVLEGDYFGYEHNAGIAGLKDHIHAVRSLEEAGSPVEGRVWFLSYPSARDGNWLDTEVLQAFINAGHKVVIDYALGPSTTDPQSFDVSDENIIALLTSPSKGLGVFDYRLTGEAFTRVQSEYLAGTLWFKSTPNIVATMALYNTLGLDTIPRLHKAKQLEACAALANLIGGDVMPSNSILMATTTTPLPPEYSYLALPTGEYKLRLTDVFAKLDRR